MTSLSKSDIETILKNKLKCKLFEIISCDNCKTDGNFIGYLSSSEKATIYYRIEGVIEKCSIFIKRLPTVPTHRELVISLGGFHREVSVFNSFLNHIKGNFGEIFPECYLARSDDILVLEDLSTKAYENRNLLEPFDLEHCVKVIDSLAKLHAASFIFERDHKKKLTDILPDLGKELIFCKEEGHLGRKRHFVGVKALRRMADVYLAQYPKEIVSKAFEFLAALPEKLDPSNKFPNPLSHSDLWSNNIMFSYDPEGKVTNACIIDFQCAAYRPVTYDVQLMLHCCTDRKHRNRFSNHLFKHYYDQLQYYLKQADIEIGSIMTWGVYEDMCKETLPVALAMAPQFTHFAAIPDQIIKPILEDDNKWNHYYQKDRDEVVLQAASISQNYKNKVVETLVEFFDYFKVEC